MTDAGFHRESVSPFVRVQAAQARRVTQAMRLSDAEIIAAFRDMPPDRAYKLAQQALSETIARAMQAAHERGV